MIKQIFKIIWNEKHINGWIMLELVLIFTILWFCCDYLFTMGKKYVEPIGFDITHTYNISLGTLPEDMIGEVSVENKEKAFDQIFERIKAHQAVEAACISAYAIPYTGSWRSVGSMVDSIQLDGLWTKNVSSEFFEVFKIDFLGGRTFNESEMLNGKYAIIGVDDEGRIKGIDPEAIDSITVQDNVGYKYKKSGYVNKVKRAEYEGYSPIIYVPLSTQDKVVDAWNTNISIRIKPDADSKDFAHSFTKEIRSQLEISPYFLVDVAPLSDTRLNYMKWTGYDNGLKSTFSITTFLIINIFLGITGTFWLRIQSRRSDIGLQMALGASRSKVRNTYILESLIILFIASLIGAVLAVNIMATGVFDNLGLPMMENMEKKDIPSCQFVIDYLFTFGTLAVITTIAVWYPSQKAAKINPAIVLRSE